MPKQTVSASEAARTLGISLDTLRRWDRSGRIKTERDAANRRRVSKAEVDRLLGHEEHHELSHAGDDDQASREPAKGG